MPDILKLKMSREELINSWNKLVKEMLNTVSLEVSVQDSQSFQKIGVSEVQGRVEKCRDLCYVFKLDEMMKNIPSDFNLMESMNLIKHT